MILPIYAYGHPVLKKEAEDITSAYPNLEQLIADMWETMYFSEGVGLAAPQIGLSVRLFVVDTVQINKENEEISQKKQEGIKKVFINATMVEESGEPWDYEEGCLSIPKVTGDVSRKPKIILEYYDERFEWHEEVFDGFNARVIQHEYDHICGVLFTERLKPIKRRMVQSKLEKIKKGIVDASYKMKFYQPKK